MQYATRAALEVSRLAALAEIAAKPAGRPAGNPSNRSRVLAVVEPEEGEGDFGGPTMALAELSMMDQYKDDGFGALSGWEVDDGWEVVDGGSGRSKKEEKGKPRKRKRKKQQKRQQKRPKKL